jgi:hypothetical protein
LAAVITTPTISPTPIAKKVNSRGTMILNYFKERIQSNRLSLGSPVDSDSLIVSGKK